VRRRTGARIVDAGVGRNLVYLLRAGFEVFGADGDEKVIGEVRALAARLAPSLPSDNFGAEPVEQDQRSMTTWVVRKD
jgi:tellurite methyltransferase